MKKLVLLLYIVIFVPLTTACWNYREVDKLTIVTGFSIDKTERGNYLLTFEVVDFNHAKEGQTIKSDLIETEGETLFSAIRNTLSRNAPKLYFGHSTVVIFSREVAQEGILKVLDFFLRDAEPRLSINLFVTEEETAGEIFKVTPLTAEFISTEITEIIDEQKNLSKALAVPAYKFVNALAGDGISGIMTSLCTPDNNGEKIVQACGTAIFKKDKLQGFISNEETFALSFILNEVKGGILSVNVGPEKDEERISLEILNSSTKIKPVYENNELSIVVNVETKVALSELNSQKNYNDEKGRNELIKIAEEQLKSKIENIISKVQKEFGADIFGFGNCFYRDLPNVWREKKGEWETLFKDLKVKVEAKVEIKHTGLLLEPIKIGD